MITTARFEHYGHGTAGQTIVGLGEQAFIAKGSQDAVENFRPYFESHPVLRGVRLEDYVAATPLTVESPQQVIEKALTWQDGFGDYQRQLFVVDRLGLPVEQALEQIEIAGTEVVPVLRKEVAGTAQARGPAHRRPT